MVQTKLFLDLYLAKFLNTSVKPFFPCMDIATKYTALYHID